MRTVSVGGFVSRSMAQLAQSHLAQHGIAAEVVADDAGGSAPHFSHATGGVSLAVAEEDAQRARELLEEGQGEGDATGAREYLRPSAMWINRVGRWVLAAVLVALVVAMFLPRLSGS